MPLALPHQAHRIRSPRPPCQDTNISINPRQLLLYRLHLRRQSITRNNLREPTLNLNRQLLHITHKYITVRASRTISPTIPQHTNKPRYNDNKPCLHMDKLPYTARHKYLNQLHIGLLLQVMAVLRQYGQRHNMCMIRRCSPLRTRQPDPLHYHHDPLHTALLSHPRHTPQMGVHI